MIKVNNRITNQPKITKVMEKVLYRLVTTVVKKDISNLIVISLMEVGMIQILSLDRILNKKEMVRKENLERKARKVRKVRKGVVNDWDNNRPFN